MIPLSAQQGVLQTPVRGAFSIWMASNSRDGGVVMTSLLKMFDEKGPAKLP